MDTSIALRLAKLKVTWPDAYNVAPNSKPAKTAKAPKKEKSETLSSIPKTGNEVWIKALGRKKLTTNALSDAVLSNLGLGEESKFTIRNRAGAWLNAAAKKNLISTSFNRDGLKVYQMIRV